MLRINNDAEACRGVTSVCLIQRSEVQRSSLTMVDSSFDEAVDNAARALGCNKLRDFQRNAAVGILKGHDVLASQPTGSGKSFFLLPFFPRERLEASPVTHLLPIIGR